MVVVGQHAVGGANLGGGAAAVESERGVVIGCSRLQLPKLFCRSGRAITLARGRNLFGGRQQVRPFEQPAEIFFTGDLDRAFLGGEADHGFIFHLQALQAHDANILRTLFPGLALAEFHEWEVDKKNLSPLM